MKICLKVLQLALPLNLKSAQVYILEKTARLPVTDNRIGSRRPATLWIIKFQQLMFFPGTPLWQSRKTLHKWKDNLVLAKPLAVCTHLSTIVSQLLEPQVPKITVFTYRRPHFCFPWRRPAIITQYVAWMERQFSACQTRRSIYLSIFNSFRVIGCLSQCVSPKIAIFTKLLFPLGMPLGQSR